METAAQMEEQLEGHTRNMFTGFKLPSYGASGEDAPVPAKPAADKPAPSKPSTDKNK